MRAAALMFLFSLWACNRKGAGPILPEECLGTSNCNAAVSISSSDQTAVLPLKPTYTNSRDILVNWDANPDVNNYVLNIAIDQNCTAIAKSLHVRGNSVRLIDLEEGTWYLCLLSAGSPRSFEVTRARQLLVVDRQGPRIDAEANQSFASGEHPKIEITDLTTSICTWSTTDSNLRIADASKVLTSFFAAVGATYSATLRCKDQADNPSFLDFTLILDGGKQSPPASSTNDTSTPMPTPNVPPTPFYPGSCAEIKKAQPTAVSGIFKIYLNPALDTRTALDASCDMSEDGGGWTLILNYSHKGNTNPPLNIRTVDLPLLADDNLGTDESNLTKNWGHVGNTLLAKFTFTDLRFYCRSSQNPRVIHFKTQDVGCIAAAKTGTGSCMNIKTGFVKLTGHTGILPEMADLSTVDQGNFALTRDTYARLQDGKDITWSVSGNRSDSWECDFGSNNFVDDTIHRVWFR